jgi:RNA polymerase sigma-70 factor (ECF subfamily)
VVGIHRAGEAFDNRVSKPGRPRQYVMNWKTTSTILNRLCAGSDDEAWTQLAARFRRPLVSFAQDVGVSATDAEDVAQETLTALVSGLRAGKYDRSKGRLSDWLFGIAWRQAMNARRRAVRRRQGQLQKGENTDLLSLAAAEENLTRVWETHWERAMLNECLRIAEREFEPATFHAFQMVVGLGRAPGVVATDLGITVKSVYNAKHRVIKRIRELRTQLEEAVEVT